MGRSSTPSKSVVHILTALYSAVQISGDDATCVETANLETEIKAMEHLGNLAIAITTCHLVVSVDDTVSIDILEHGITQFVVTKRTIGIFLRMVNSILVRGRYQIGV